MKRRVFLQIFGAAVATPFLPVPAVAAKTVAPYTAASVHAAIYHAKSRAVFSVWGLARALNLPMESAEALMGDLAKRGIVGPMQGTTFGGRWASSKIMDSEALTLSRAAKRTTSHHQTRHTYVEPNLSKMMAHLQQLCRDQGMHLSPRCATY